MMNRRPNLLHALPIALVVILALTAGLTPSAHPQAPAELRVAFNREFQSLDPGFHAGAPDWNILSNVMNWLVRYKRGSTEIEGDLAERWTTSEDGRVHTFYLRRDVVWQKGFGRFTAADVKYSIERIKNDERSPFSNDYEFVERVDTPDDYTVRITMTRPYGAFLTAVLALNGFITNRGAIERLGQAYVTNPVGTGPFAVQRYERRQQTVLVAHEGYFRGVPRIARVFWRVIPDESAAALALQRNEINYMIVRDPTVYRTLKSAQGVCRTETPALGWLGLVFNTKRAPVADVRIRRAIAHAINRQLMADTIGEGMARVASSSLIPPGMFGHTDNIAKYPFNQATARQMLADAAPPGGLDLVLLHRANVADVATAIQRFLGDVGVRVKLDLVDPGVYQQRRRVGDWHFLLTEPTRFEPDQMLDFFHSRNAPLRNDSRYDGVDALIDQQKFEPNQARRRATLVQIQQKMAQDVPVIALWNPLYVTAYNCALEGHESHSGFWMTRFEGMGFRQ
jgi:peptide/nickel transport system substrate-binding protein